MADPYLQQLKRRVQRPTSPWASRMDIAQDYDLDFQTKSATHRFAKKLKKLKEAEDKGEELKEAKSKDKDAKEAESKDKEAKEAESKDKEAREAEEKGSNV